MEKEINYLFIKKGLLTFLLLIVPFMAYSQKTIHIKGIVVEAANREPIIGASIIVKGTSIGTITDINGEYQLNVPETAKTIEVNYLGMDPLSIPFSTKNLGDFRFIELRENAQKLSEVVVVGFGTQKKESVIGAIQTVKAKDLVVPSSSLTSAFAGKIAGVIAVQRSGEPGADGASFWIRGISTFAGPTNPLIVMDGVEISSSELNSIAPESIENFSILKDATATALYGAKGANGVMVITTKSGRDMDKPKINVRAEYFMTSPTKLPKLVDGVNFMKLYNYAAEDRGSGVQLYPDDKIVGTENKLNPYIYPNSDWYGMMFKDVSHNQSVNLNITGGSKKIDYFINASMFNETGMYKNSIGNSFNDINISQKRFSFQNNINAQLTSSTKIGLRLMTQIRDHEGPGKSSSAIFANAYQMSPVEFPAYFPQEANVNHIMFGNKANNPLSNPLAALLTQKRNEFEANVLSSFNIDQKLDFITPGLSVRGLASFQYWSKKSSVLGYDPFYYEIFSYDSDTYDYVLSPVGAKGTESIRVMEDWRGMNSTVNFQIAFDYNRVFADKHTVSGMILYHQREYKTPSGNLYEVLPYREQGFAGRATYDFDNRYFAEFNFGYNGSDNFMKGNRFGFFPSIAVGYMISNESFFNPIRNVVSMLKIRGSYGLVGNSYTNPRFPYLTEVFLNNGDRGYTFGETWNNYLPGVKVSKYGEAGAKWETGKKLNGGLEFTLFNKLTAIVDVFKEERSGIFMQRRIIPSTMGIGDALPYANIGRVENKGCDVSLDFNHAFNKDFIVNFKANITYAQNKLLERDEPEQLYAYQSEIGQPLNRPFGLIAEGLYTDADIEAINSGKQARPTFSSNFMAGDIKYKDMNEDGVIDNFDRTFFGNPEVPNLVYGFGASLKYKNFDCSLFFQGVGGTTIMMNAHPFGNYKYQMLDFIAEDHWTKENPNSNALYPRLSAIDNNHNQNSSFWAKDGSFLRLKNAEVGYTWKSFRAYVNGSNLLTISKFKYWDPEIGSGSGLSYPTLRVFNIGIQMTFN